MSADGPPKSALGDSEKTRQGWLAKYRMRLSSLSKGKIPLSPRPTTEKAIEEEPSASSASAAKDQLVHEIALDAALKAAQEKYSTTRQHILALENENAWYHNVRPKIKEPLEMLESASPQDTAKIEQKKEEDLELRANHIIRAIREYERDVIFGNRAGEALPGQDTLDMGGQFLTNKNRIEQRSKLYEIAKMVPKGAILHLHFNAELNPEQLLEMARNMPNMYIRSTQPLTTKAALRETEMVFNVMPPTTRNANVFDENYKGANYSCKEWTEKDDHVWMKWSDFREQFKEKFPDEYVQTPGKSALDSSTRTCSEPGHVILGPAENWIRQKMVLSEEEVYRLSQTVNGIWARFNQSTRCFKGLLNYESVYTWYIGQAIDRMIEEKVMYAELRPMLLDKYLTTNDGLVGKLDHSKQMQLILDAVEKKKQQLQDSGSPNTFKYGLKVIYCTPRSISMEMMARELQNCIQLKREFPELICGFDLVGAEDRPNHIGAYAPLLVAFKETCKRENLDIPFMFHAGETLLDTGGSEGRDPTKSNLYDAYALGAKRIGHGFSLLKHPELLEKFRRKEDQDHNMTDPGICVELCPISNELLHLCRNIKEHPFPQLLAAGIPCTVNSDNPSLFSNSMSHEFYQVMVGTPTMTIYGWKQLAHWSIDYSCLSRADKPTAKEEYHTAWKQFCRDVVAKYDSLMADGMPLELDWEKAQAAYSDSGACTA